MTALRYGRRKGLYCRYEEEDSQRHPEERRAGKESSRLSMTNRLNPVMRGGGGGERERWGERQEKTKGTKKEHDQIVGSYGNEKGREEAQELEKLRVGCRGRGEKS